MRKYKLWNRKTKINGVEASHFLNEQPFKDYEGDIILIYSEEDETKVSQVECKEILANIYEIDVNLPLDEFMAEYFEKVEAQEQEPIEVEE